MSDSRNDIGNKDQHHEAKLELQKLRDLQDKLVEQNNDYGLKAGAIKKKLKFLKDTPVNSAERKKYQTELNTVISKLDESKVENQIKKVSEQIAKLETEIYGKPGTDSPRSQNSL